MQPSPAASDDPAFWSGRERVAARAPYDQRSRWPRWLQILIIETVAVVAVGSIVHVPFHSLGPGPTYNMFDFIDVEGVPTHPSEGELHLTTASVSTEALSLWEAAYAWVRPDLGTIHRFDLVPPWSTSREEERRNKQAIEESKVAALVGAFGALGEPTVPGSIIVGVQPSAPADGVLRAGDHVIEVDGRAVATPDALVRAIRRREPGDRVRFTLIRRGRRTTLATPTICIEDVEADGTVATHVCSDDVDGTERPYVGIELGPAYRFPDDLRIDTGDVVGPSGGLVFALTIVDLFTGADLTGGRVIAVTGTIQIGQGGRAVVGPIGGVAEKVRGAEAAGATVFVVPRQEARDARVAAPPGMRVIGVRTLEDAVVALRSLEPASSAAG